MEYPGLYNSICENPTYYCLSKQLYLEEEHAKKKHCLEKPTMDMISTRKCPYLLTIEEYKKQKETMKERIDTARKNYKAEKHFLISP